MFEENNIEKYSLVTVKTLLDYGVENQLLDKKVADKLLEFYNTLN
jgi:hypothetical protein